MIARNREEGSKSVYIGAACYPTLAMFNHSCDPGIIRFYIEDYVCVQTIKNIKKGEEICENYGPIFFHSPKDDRQVKSQYHILLTQSYISSSRGLERYFGN